MILQKQKKDTDRVFVNLPKTETEALNWKPGDTVVAILDRERNAIILQKIK